MENSTYNIYKLELLKKEDTDSFIRFKFNALGVDKKSVDILFEDDVITINCESIYYGKLFSAIRINNCSINVSKISASLDEGILTILLPRFKEQKTSKKIILN